jgi:hypothetical protein
MTIQTDWVKLANFANCRPECNANQFQLRPYILQEPTSSQASIIPVYLSFSSLSSPSVDISQTAKREKLAKKDGAK